MKRVLDLPFGRPDLVPFQLRENDVFRTGDRNLPTADLLRLSPLEFFRTEWTILSHNQIDLIPRGKINDIEHGAAGQSVAGRFDTHIVSAAEVAHEFLQTF